MSEDDDKTRILRGPRDDDSPTRVLAGPGVGHDVEDDEDGERTRILPRTPEVAAKPAVVVAPPGKPGDRIVFQCPNGHRIIVGKQFAGKRGKCNKCGADVQIPSSPSASRGTPPAGMFVGPPPEEDEAGSDGSDEASPDENEPPSLEALAFGELAAKASPVIEDFGNLGIEGADESEAPDDVPDWNFDTNSAPSAAEATGWSAPGAAPSFDSDDGNPTAQLVAKLWSEREHGGVVELHLKGGAVLLPEWYDSKWSKGTHGLFASQAPDGSVTLTAVAWESIEKVVVRQLAAVPDDMFT
jgi:hypothetical protein